MKHLILSALLVLAGCAERDPPATFDPGDYRGDWVVINYWAEWCKPCIDEIPELNELQETRPDVTVLGVNYDGVTGAELRRQSSALGIEFEILAEDPATALGVSRPTVLPTTYVVDPRGRVSERLVGPQTLESLSRAVPGK